MFERRGFWVFRVLAALLLIGALVVAGIMLYQAGRAQGYAMGLAAEGAGNGQAVPPDRLGPGWGYGYGYGFRPPLFFPFGLFFFCLIPLLFFFLFGGLFRAFAWRGHPGAWGPGHGGHAHWHTHPHGPQPEGSQPPSDQPAENR